MIWSWVKTDVRKNNFNCKNAMQRIYDLAHAKKDAITAVEWEKAYIKSREFADEYYVVDDTDETDDITSIDDELEELDELVEEL
jgi:hypothetical protein